MSKDATICQECGMEVRRGEYHPYAACLMFKACGDRETVQSILLAIHGPGARSGTRKGSRRRGGAERRRRNGR